MNSSILLFIIILVERRGEGRKKRVKSDRTGSSLFREKSNDACSVIIAPKMSQCPGIMTIEVKQHRI